MLIEFPVCYSFCYHTKEIWGWKLVYQQSPYSLAFLIFPQKKFLSSFPENILKNITASELFTYESIKVSNFANIVWFNQELNLFCFSKLRYQNNKNYLWLLLLLSGDTSLNPRPINSSQQYNNYQWVVFKKRGLHFVHININSLLPKIDEL